MFNSKTPMNDITSKGGYYIALKITRIRVKKIN